MPHPYDPTPFPAPGEPTSSRSGSLTAVQQNGFPSVLLGVNVAGASWIRVLRHTVGTPDNEWIVVRSGVVRLGGGTGQAVDNEVEPGKTYTYRLEFTGESGTEHDVTVTMDGWRLRRETGYVKPLRRPELSQPVIMLPPGPFTRPVIGGGSAVGLSPYAFTTWQGRRARTVSFTIFTDGDDADLIEQALSVGELLWQPRPERRSRPMYLMPGEMSDQHSAGDEAREFTVTFEEIARPVDVDVPPVMPGWTWNDYTVGHTLDSFAATYNDQWGLMLAGARRQWRGRGVALA